VIAPVSGRIAQKTVQTGNRLTVGQALMAVVEDNVWILANLKETQLEDSLWSYRPLVWQ
jgi:membrane fusion protein, multidrug efflux system